MKAIVNFAIVFLSIFTWGCSDASDEVSSAAPCATSASLAWDTQIGAVFEQKCGSCHPGQQSTNYKTYAGVTSGIEQVSASINNGSMPPSGGLDETTKATISAWRKAGMPQSICR